MGKVNVIERLAAVSNFVAKAWSREATLSLRSNAATYFLEPHYGATAGTGCCAFWPGTLARLLVMT